MNQRDATHVPRGSASTRQVKGARSVQCTRSRVDARQATGVLPESPSGWHGQVVARQRPCVFDKRIPRGPGRRESAGAQLQRTAFLTVAALCLFLLIAAHAAARQPETAGPSEQVRLRRALLQQGMPELLAPLIDDTDLAARESLAVVCAAEGAACPAADERAALLRQAEREFAAVVAARDRTGATTDDTPYTPV